MWLEDFDFSVRDQIDLLDGTRLGLCSLEQGSKGSSSQADRAGVACRWGTPWTIYVAFSPELRRKLL